MRIDRLKSMEELVINKGSASLEELAEHFNVSINTIRRDLDELLERGSIKKVYGGVVCCLPGDIVHREDLNISAKQTIGSLAAQLIEDNSTVFIDSGTTTAHVIPFLSNKTNVTIITNSLKAMIETSKYSNLKLLAIGGYFNPSRFSFVGADTIESMAKLNFDKVLIGTTNVSLTNGLSINSHFEVDIKRWLVKNFKGKITLLADSDKFDKSALYSFCNFDDVSTIVSDRQLPQNYIQRMAANGITFVCPE